MRGILMSRTARSTGWAVKARSASDPSLYVRTLNPSLSRAMDTDVRMFLSSSTKAIVWLTNLSRVSYASIPDIEHCRRIAAKM
jgi:hypothetical protein